VRKIEKTRKDTESGKGGSSCVFGSRSGWELMVRVNSKDRKYTDFFFTVHIFFLYSASISCDFLYSMYQIISISV